MFVNDLMKAFKGDNLEVRNDDDRVDRLNYRWNVVVLILFAGLVTAQTYIMQDRIRCWVPAHFKGAWEDYTNDYCWIRNTYYLPWDEHVPLDHQGRDKYPIVYYQWVPLFMLIQAMFFYAPIVVWRSMNAKTGIDVNDMVESSERVQRSNDEKVRGEWVAFLTRQMDRYLGVSRKPLAKDAGAFSGGTCNCKWFLSVFCVCCMGKRFGNYMTILYIITKVLFCVNVIGQIFILNWFLGRNFNLYGIQLIKSWISGETLEESPYFPRVTFCDVEVRRLGNLQRYTVQCVLPINMFNEKIYAFLWFWFFFIAAMNVFSLITWIIRVVMKVDSYRYVKKHLQSNTPKRAFNPERQTDRDRLKVFMNHYLRSDGVLVLRLIDYNTNKVTVEDLMTSLWINFIKKRYDYQEDDEESPKDNKIKDNIVDDEKQPLVAPSPGASSSSDSDNMAHPTEPYADTSV